MEQRSAFAILVDCVLAAFLGALIGGGVTFVGDWVGALLEGALQVTLRAWELVTLVVAFINVPGGAVSGLVGVWSRRPLRGFVIGVVLHGVVFGALILTSDSLQAAPSTVNGWVLVVGTLAGGLAGLVGGVLGRRAVR